MKEPGVTEFKNKLFFIPGLSWQKSLKVRNAIKTNIKFRVLPLKVASSQVWFLMCFLIPRKYQVGVL